MSQATGRREASAARSIDVGEAVRPRHLVLLQAARCEDRFPARIRSSSSALVSSFLHVRWSWTVPSPSHARRPSGSCRHSVSRHPILSTSRSPSLLRMTGAVHDVPPPGSYRSPTTSDHSCPSRSTFLGSPSSHGIAGRSAARHGAREVGRNPWSCHADSDATNDDKSDHLTTQSAANQPRLHETHRRHNDMGCAELNGSLLNPMESCGRSVARTLANEASNGDHAPNSLDNPEGPCAGQEAVGAGQRTAKSESSNEHWAAPFECIHDHHEGQSRNAEGGEHVERLRHHCLRTSHSWSVQRFGALRRERSWRRRPRSSLVASYAALASTVDDLTGQNAG